MKTMQYDERIVYKKIYLKICCIYAVSSAVWILFSDEISSLFADNIGEMALINMVKGCIFVLITTVLLYSLMKIFLKKIAVINQRLRDTNQMLQKREQELFDNFRLLMEKTEALQKSEKRFKSLFDNMITGLSVYKILDADNDGKVEFQLLMANAAFESLMNFQESDIIGQKLSDIFSASDTSWQGPLQEVAATGTPYFFIVFEKRTKKYLKGIAYRSEKNSITMHFFDATESILAQQKNEYMAYHDALTQLTNSYFYKEILRQAILEKMPFSVILMDLDNFKGINDTLGHSVGDKLLQDISKRLKSIVFEPNIISRWGGDEFIFIVKNQEGLVNLDNFIESLHQAVAVPWQYNKSIYHITCKMGVAMFPADSQDSDTLIKQADMAMYKAKKKAGDRFYCLYHPAMEFELQQRSIIENELHLGITGQEFILYYQPQVDLDGKFIGVEALVRWQNPRKGLISPDKFIPFAEENGLILPLGAWIFRDACRQIREWDRDYGLKIHVSINLSPKQFLQKNLIGRIEKVIYDTEIDPRQITIEITETTTIENAEKTSATLKDLKKLGIKIALDDFGTGYSSLIYLQKFPFDTIKIDQSFIRDITTDTETKHITKTIIDLAKNLHYTTIAEGVETIEQVNILKELKCDCFQGYFFSRPVPANEIAAVANKLKFSLQPDSL
jgi:diguanylate cyclase (GGDEF)-like protein